MKKKIQTKLQLSTETIKTLDAKQLAQVGGAGKPPSVSCWALGCTHP